MADVLVRDVPEEVLAGVDAHAARLGLSRVEYIRRRLAADRCWPLLDQRMSVDDHLGQVRQ